MLHISKKSDKHHLTNVSSIGVLMAMGIVYGDIGTSPLYVVKSIVTGQKIDDFLIFGFLSCIFWTLTMQTTIKYAALVLRADNKGHGGIFALYSLVRKSKEWWLIILAMIGGAALLADGIITPAISVSSAIEGLQMAYHKINTVAITVCILIALFAIQRFGTNFIGKMFGPIMSVWFIMLFIFGIVQIFIFPSIVKAINPIYAYQFIFHYPKGFWFLGAVFLCVTGAEAMYSDISHCGRNNVVVGWAFVKIALVVNYFGQGAWLLDHSGKILPDNINPFYAIIPHWFLIPGIIIATMATIIASQSLITGSFALVNQAIRLNLFPKLETQYPTEYRAQMYVPMINLFLCIACVSVTLYFKESTNMESAYGLSVILTMITTTILFGAYLRLNRTPLFLVLCFLITYLTIEATFFVANLAKFSKGGWITLTIGAFLFSIMWVWSKARMLKRKGSSFISIKQALPSLAELSKDLSIPKYATHLAYLTATTQTDNIETQILYSILERQPKRADIYWFIHVDTVDDPYLAQYKITTLVPENVMRIDFHLGFKVEPRISLFFQKVVKELIDREEIKIINRYDSPRTTRKPVGDFTFVILHKVLPIEHCLSVKNTIIMKIYSWLHKISAGEDKSFGLDSALVTIENVPMSISHVEDINLERIK